MPTKIQHRLLIDNWLRKELTIKWKLIKDLLWRWAIALEKLLEICFSRLLPVNIKPTSVLLVQKSLLTLLIFKTTKRYLFVYFKSSWKLTSASVLTTHKIKRETLFIKCQMKTYLLTTHRTFIKTRARLPTENFKTFKTFRRQRKWMTKLKMT